MNRLKNTTLVLVSLLFTWCLLEALALSIFYYLLPPLANPLLDDGLPPLLQHNKQGLRPHHYIALTGDSYAMGLGDHYYRVAGERRATYGSAPFIHQITGRDVVSFGSAGNGSIAGIVTEPLSTLAYWQASTRINGEAPGELWIYFYEGNDLNDNVEYLQHTSKKRLVFDDTRLHDSSYFQGYIQQVALEQDSLYRQAQSLRGYDEFYFSHFAAHAAAVLAMSIKNHVASDEVVAAAEPERSPLNPPGRYEWREPGTINQARVNGNTLQLPDQLQGPSMDLTEDEKEIALVSFRESLHFVKQALPHTKLRVVYLPSVISCYDITSPQVSLQSPARRGQYVFDALAVRKHSDWIAQHIASISMTEQVEFVDARAALREGASKQPIHGPLDWNHFNETGYEVLAGAMVK